MKASLLLLPALFLMCLTGPDATAQDWAKSKLEKSPRHGEWVDVKHGARTVRCFIVYPEVNKKATAVIVIHEIFGMTDWVRDMTDQIAAGGCIAIAPDLLSGAGPKGGGSEDFAGVDDVRGAISKLPPDQITGDLNAVADYVKALPSASDKLAVAGFCWGGGQTFRFACNRPDLKAACVFYGPPPSGLEEIQKIQCPVYGFYGGDDFRIGSTIPKATEWMKAAGKTYKPVTYTGAGHGFMRAGEDPAGTEANKKARDEGFKRLEKILKGL